MSPAPVNVRIPMPTIAVDGWPALAHEWQQLNASAYGHPEFFPLTIKAAYVIGVIYDICTSVNCLLRAPGVSWQTTYLPAYGVFASSLDVLGRCIRGNRRYDRGSSRDIETGFKWLVSSSPDRIGNDHPLIRTNSGSYTIDMLVALRHFAAHGQAAAQFMSLDGEILSYMPPLLADGLERYWNELQQDEDLCNHLALANIQALRGFPVWRSWSLFERDEAGVYHSITSIFNRFDWRVNDLHLAP
jgi:hypothetical protein